MVLTYILASVILVSLISFVGLVTLSKYNVFEKNLMIFVSFAAGALLGGAFFHLLPESFNIGNVELIMIFALLGIISFFFIEQFLHWHHHHHHHKHRKGQIKGVSYLNLIGDGVHNFVDGLIIGASYLISIPLGLASTIAIALHEIPQEVGDFAILIYGGFKKWRALYYNFLSALTAIAGGITAYLVSGRIENFSLYLLPFAAGGFIYIASSDLIPELHKVQKSSKIWLNFIMVIVGIALMRLIGVLA